MSSGLIQINMPGTALCSTPVMSHDTEHQPGALAPATGHYRPLNATGTPTSHSAHVPRGEPLPTARGEARGGWGGRPARMSERRPSLAELTAEQLLARAAEYRRLAGTARARGSLEPLLELAEQWEGMAGKRQAERHGCGRTVVTPPHPAP